MSKTKTMHQDDRGKLEAILAAVVEEREKDREEIRALRSEVERLRKAYEATTAQLLARERHQEGEQSALQVRPEGGAMVKAEKKGRLPALPEGMPRISLTVRGRVTRAMRILFDRE